MPYRRVRIINGDTTETLLARVSDQLAAPANELGISETTTRQHLSGLYRRTGCLNAAQAAYWLGLADAGPSTATATPSDARIAVGRRALARTTCAELSGDGRRRAMRASSHGTLASCGIKS